MVPTRVMTANKNCRGQSCDACRKHGGSTVSRPICSNQKLSSSHQLVSAALLILLAFGAGCNPPGRRELLLGKQLVEQGRPLEAIEPLKQAISLFGTNTTAAARAWNWLGLAYHYSGQAQEALRAYQNAIKSDFNLFAVRYNLGCLLLEHTNLNGAINELVTYTSHQPNDPAGWLRLGTAQFQAKLYDQAEKSLQKVIDLNGSAVQCAEAMNLIGMSRAARRHPQDAVQAFESALTFQSNYAPALLNHAIVAHTQLNNRTLALQKYRAYLNAIGGATNNTSVANLVAQLEAQSQPRQITTNQVALPEPTNRIVAAEPIQASTNAAAKSVPAAQKVLPQSTGQVVALTSPPKIVVSPPEPASLQAQTNALAKLTPKTTSDVSVTSITGADARLTQPEPVTPAAGQTNAVTHEMKEPEPAVRVEIVKLDNEPPVKPATEIEVPQRQTPPRLEIGSAQLPPVVSRPAEPVPTPTNVTTMATSPAPATASVEHDETVVPKRSWFQRLNPVNLFRSRSKSAAETPQAETQVARSSSQAAPTSAASAGEAVSEKMLATATRPSFPRYNYLTPPMPVPGNRALAERHYAAGLLAQKAGSLAQAIREYQQAVAVDPSYFEAQYNLGVAAYDARNWPLALEAFEHALAIKPNDFGARFNLALALEKAGYPLDAANELETLLALNPNKPEVHFAAANLYAQVLDDKPMARAHYSRVLELDPQHPHASAIRRWLLANRAR